MWHFCEVSCPDPLPLCFFFFSTTFWQLKILSFLPNQFKPGHNIIFHTFLYCIGTLESCVSHTERLSPMETQCCHCHTGETQHNQLKPFFSEQHELISNALPKPRYNYLPHHIMGWSHTCLEVADGTAKQCISFHRSALPCNSATAEHFKKCRYIFRCDF